MFQNLWKEQFELQNNRKYGGDSQSLNKSQNVEAKIMDGYKREWME